MTNFCKQCSSGVFGEDSHDLAGLCDNQHMARAICKGCGPIWVNHLGECMTPTCLRQHGKGIYTALAKGIEK